MKKSSSTTTTFCIQLEEVDILNLARKVDPTIPDDAQIVFSKNDNYRTEAKIKWTWTTEEE